MFIYNPQNASIEELELTLTPERRELAKRLMKRFQAAFDKEGSHYVLVVSPRGGGKTHLLTYTWQKLIQRNKEQLSIIHLSEEERGITSFLDMMLTILNAMGDAPKNYRELIRSGGMREASSRAEAIIDETLNGKQALLVVENISVLFQGMSTQDLHALRAFFQRHPRLSIIGSTITLFNESKKADHPFYGFFTIHTIAPLNVKDATSYLRQMAEMKKDQKLVTLLQQPEGRHRVAAIHALTGGNHRLLALLSGFLDAEGLNELVNPFIRLVDRELTPYYQQSLDRLSPLQNKILNAIAAHHGRAITVKEIADYTFATSQTVSGQLRSLTQQCYVKRNPVGRETCYELREPLMRLVLDIKEGRDRPLPLIVSFLRQWYQVDELQSLLGHCPPGSKCYYEAAISAVYQQQFNTSKIVNKARKWYAEKFISWKNSSTNSNEIRLLNALLSGVSCEDAKRFDDAINVYQLQLTANEVESFPVLRAHMLFRIGVSLGKLDRLDQALEAFDEIIDRHKDAIEPEIREQVARAQLNRAVTLGEMNRSDEELETYDEIIDRHKDAIEPEIREQVVMAQFNRAVALEGLERFDEALKAYQAYRKEVVSDGLLEKEEHLQRIFYCDDRSIGILLEQGDYNKAIRYLEERIASEDDVTEKSIIQMMGAKMLDEFVLTSGLLSKLLSILESRENLLDEALIAWVQVQTLDLNSKEYRSRFVQKANSLMKALKDSSVSELALNVISAMCRHAEGDNKALLELPKEIRQLFQVKTE